MNSFSLNSGSRGPPGVALTSIVIVGDTLRNDQELARALTAWSDITVTYVSDITSASTSNVPKNGYILDAFEEPTGTKQRDPDFLCTPYAILHDQKATLLGPSAIKALANIQPTPQLVSSTRQLFTIAMRGMVICFSGFKSKDRPMINKLIFYTHSMGGRVLQNVATAKCDDVFLVAKECKGEQYTYASTFDIPVVQMEWITDAWSQKHDPAFSANRADFINKWKVKPFHGASIFFLGFQEKEHEHMVDELVRNGGNECNDYKSEPCTHVVVDDTTITSMPPEVGSDTFVVKSEWFWTSIQMDACAEENMHMFNDALGSFLSPRTPYFSPTTPGSHTKRRKRRTEVMRQLAQSVEGHAALNDGICGNVAGGSSTKRGRSSDGKFRQFPSDCNTGDGSYIAPSPEKGVSQSTPDINTTPIKRNMILSPLQSRQAGHNEDAVQEEHTAQFASPKQPLSARHQVFSELVQTEENFVSILHTIIDVFKMPLEKDIKQNLLNQTEIKIIFGNVPPILEVHSEMAKEFKALLNEWKEPVIIGDVLLKFASKLASAYPNFVNFFEDTKKTLDHCDKNNPRFHAFLKVCQSRRECGRQTLPELLIRPVQRLPSITLLLTDLLKHTKKEKDHPDIPALEAAISKIKDVLTGINENKRKTEGQMHIFEIFSDIENCPPHLVSANRNYLGKLDVVELGGSDKICGKGSDLTLFLFSDVLEISKQRKRHMAAAGGRGLSREGGLSIKSPSTISLRSVGIGTAGNLNSGSSRGPVDGPTHKHAKLINMTSIRRVIDLVVEDTDGTSPDCFAIICRSHEEMTQRMFVFQIVSDDFSKPTLLNLLCRGVANGMFRSDPDIYKVQMKPDELGLSVSDLSVVSRNTYERGINRVKKAFSFNRTPTTSKLTRAMFSLSRTPTMSRLSRAVLDQGTK